MGTLRGFDDYVNMVLDDVTEYEIDADGTKRKIQLDQVLRAFFIFCFVFPFQASLNLFFNAKIIRESAFMRSMYQYFCIPGFCIVKTSFGGDHAKHGWATCIFYMSI